MPSRKEIHASKAIALVRQTDAVIPTSKLPPPLRFPLLVLLSLTLSSLLYSLVAEYTAGDLARVSRTLDRWWEVGALVGWRTFELGLGWYCNYDGYDLAALSLLSHGPPLYLLSAFYDVRPITAVSSLLIDILTTYIPFRLLRPLSLAHSASTSQDSVAVANKEVVTDVSIQTSTTLLAASIYSVTLYAAYVTYLPVSLATHFNNIPTIAVTHTATPISLFPLNILLGLAARSFIFTPAVAAAPSLADARASAFNPATATLLETVRHNVWDCSTRTKVVVKRTLAVVLVSGVNTLVQTLVTIEGVEAAGALAYAGVWAAAAGITGLVLGLVGSV